MIQSIQHNLKLTNVAAGYPCADGVERLVLATVIKPLREDWKRALAVAELRANSGDDDSRRDATQVCRDFHFQLTTTIVLDPVCGTGQFLCAALDHMLRLEREVLEATAHFDESRESEIDTQKFHVDPRQFLGLENDPRVAAIAERALGDVYVHWQTKSPDATSLPQPAFSNYRNIDCRDALLDYDRREPLLNKMGAPITRWDGKTLKAHPTTCEPVPDHNFRVPVWRYINPRKSCWPVAHFIIGKPPIIDGSRMRGLYGESYIAALRAVHPEVPEGAEFGMYWWNHAANILRSGASFLPASSTSLPIHLRRFGFITTTNIRKIANRAILKNHIENAEISIALAIPDHPFRCNADGAATRTAITVVQSGQHPGVLMTESRVDIPVCLKSARDDTSTFTFKTQTGTIHPDLTVGADIASTIPLLANNYLAHSGVHLNGGGFTVTRNEAHKLGLDQTPGVEKIIRPYRNGSDITGSSRDVMVIDFFGYTADQAATQYPKIYQWLRSRVKPERDQSRNEDLKTQWWLHGNPQSQLRAALAGLPRYIATVAAAKHRYFIFLDAAVMPDHKLMSIALSDAYYLGVLSSRIHTTWAAAAGINYDISDTPIYSGIRCFDSFPFPTPTPAQADVIRALGERLDVHRRIRQSLHPRLTLTMCYNVLEKQRTGKTLTPKDQAIWDDGLIDEFKKIHDDLDAAVANAYALPADLPEEDILTHLVALNHDRAAEEIAGFVRSLRSE